MSHGGRCDLASYNAGHDLRDLPNRAVSGPLEQTTNAVHWMGSYPKGAVYCRTRAKSLHLILESKDLHISFSRSFKILIPLADLIIPPFGKKVNFTMI